MSKIPPAVRAVWDPSLRPWLQVGPVMPTRAREPGRAVRVETAGRVVVKIESPPMVTLRDLSQVIGHEVVHVARSTSHLVRFVGGGLLRYAYNERGELIELSMHDLQATHLRDGSIVVETGQSRP